MKNIDQSSTAIAAAFKGTFLMTARVPIIRQKDGRYKALAEVPPQLFHNPETRGLFTIFSRN